MPSRRSRPSRGDDLRPQCEPDSRCDRGGPVGPPADESHPRFASVPRVFVLGREVPVAAGFRVRLLGLAHLDRADAGPGLLIPRCSSVHTFGMRFALDLFFLDGEGAVLATRLFVPPRRLAAHRWAAAVLEVPSRAPR